jgi:hypothetical protein
MYGLDYHSTYGPRACLGVWHLNPRIKHVPVFLYQLRYAPTIYNAGFTSPLAIVPLPASFNSGPNVLPKSLLTFMTGVSLVSVVSHQVTTTLFVSESISTLVESASVVLLT